MPIASPKTSMEPILNSPDDEIAELERELARIPRRRSESAIPGDSVEPPPMLASRTCAKLWTTMDSKQQENYTEKQEDYTPNSGTFLDSAFFSPETVLPAAYLLGTSEPEEIKPRRNSDKDNTLKATRAIEINTEPPPQHSHWIGLVASVSVGILAAFFLFPMVAMITRSTQSYVTSSWESEIHHRVGNYERIHANQNNASQSEALLPYNLAASSWQELCSDVFIPRPSESRVEAMYASGLQPPTPPDIQGQQAPVLPLVGFTDWNLPVSLDTHSMADAMLLVMPGWENAVHHAFGQNILLRDGRVFFRILPAVESPKK